MSRSNNNQIFNPCTRWFDWAGGADTGHVEYYDKEKDNGENKDPGGNIKVSLPFVFIVLDQLSTIKGWNKPSMSGISSNEVRNSTTDNLYVKSFKGGAIASGLYQAIKSHIVAAGGHFTTNIYIAYKDASGNLALGSIQFKGVALNSWVEFCKKAKGDIMKKAIVVSGFQDGKNGGISFRTPVFKLKDITEATNAQAIEIDKTLQEYLTQYFSRKRNDEPIVPVENESSAENNNTAESRSSAPVASAPAELTPEVVADDDLPF